MHVGHLRSTILGESICRILEFIGHDVRRINHLGDWGTQFGMLIAHLKDQYPDFLTNQPSIADLESFYKASKKRFDTEPEFKKTSQENVVLLQSYNEVSIAAWKLFCKLSQQEYAKIYSRLQITITNKGESWYNKMIPGVIEELESLGLVKLDDGAKCIFIPKKKVPLIILKSDGGFNYDSTDMAAVRHRLLEVKADRCIYITDVGQFPHFFMIFKAAEMAKWHTPPKTRLDHMGFGLVQNEDGKKFKTRSGETVKLMSLLDEAKQKAYEQLYLRKYPVEEPQEGIVEEAKMGTVITAEETTELEEKAEKIGMAAIKYFDLKQNRIGNYRFSYKKMLDPKGDSAVYLLYAYARICSILKKSELSDEELMACAAEGGFKVSHPHERILAQMLVRFPDLLSLVVNDLKINLLCEFIYSICVRFNEGYNKYKIVGTPDMKSKCVLLFAI